MQDSSPIDRIKSFFDADRGVSPVIAVALLILIAIGFAVAIQGVGSDIVDSVQEPPEANIDGNPGENSLLLTVESVQNADQLRVQVDGAEEELDDDPSAGTTYSLEEGEGQWDANSNQITVVAINLPEDERVVYTYQIP